MPNSISQFMCGWLCACENEHLPFAQKKAGPHSLYSWNTNFCIHGIQKMVTVNLSDLGHTLMEDAPFFREVDEV